MIERTLFERIRDKLRAAVADRPAAGETGRQALALIPGMTIAEPCQLLAHYDARRHPKNAIAELKMNGMRALCPPARIVTRNALPFDAALHCRPILDKLEAGFGCPMVFDGEYVEDGGLDATLAAHKRGEGSGVLWLFDAVPYEEWKRNRFTHPLRIRKRALSAEFEKLEEQSFVGLLAYTDVDADMVRPMAEQVWQNGGEGLVIKDADAPYYRGKSSLWQKVKKRDTYDARIFDVIMDDARERAVSVLVRDGLDRVHRVTGIPDELAARMWRLPSLYSGKMIEFAATDTNDAGKLTGTRFVRLREDL